ncbi:DUF6153 family protein [Streptomyces sp. A3M-1-3]|uniref:DUF6153 family protein n=1 Tax=Streptomyces sp. A3M-1-3 TaxID=2962044 RepID=UPI0020B6AD4C|nr:DUF6153 family protein [Streptomyces sp. A3M-1-3]MCP3817535.1 DUF6153 family protein [Streptomyces sp. A3M-1-3]
MTTRGATFWRQVLLFAALLFGIVTMHTLGHPAQEHGPQGPAEHTVSAAAPPEHHTGHTSHQTAASADGQTGAGYAGPALPGMDMDPMAVCLAVLGAFTLVVLATGLLRTRPAGAHPVGRDPLLRAMWPHPPPRKTVLATLSVLRI